MTARYYDASKNEAGGYLPGVPLRDLTEAEFDALPAHLQASLDASPMYRKTAVPKAKAPTVESNEGAMDSKPVPPSKEVN